MKKNELIINGSASPLAKLAVVWAKLYYAFSKEIMDRLGEEEGKDLLVSCIKKYAKIRGEDVAANVKVQNLELNAENFVRNYDSSFGEIQKECLRIFPEAKLEKADGTTFCPYKEVWESYPGGNELAVIYCEEFHKAMWGSYHPDLKVKQDQIMTRGDKICTFETYMEGDKEPVLIFNQD